MNSDKIAHFIKDIRKKNGLTQTEFAKKYGVTYQAVSKWENGKNIPDIAILHQMCQDYNMNLDDFLKGKPSFKKKSYVANLMIVFFLVLGLSFLLIFHFHKDSDNFYLKTLSTTCEDFTLYGSIAYNSNQTAIRISDISYCGNNTKEVYQKLTCKLYEIDDKTKTEITSSVYERESPTTLEEFLKEVEFHIDHFSPSCKMYQENALQVEIEALKENGEVVYYQIPLTLNDTCDF